MTPAVGGLVVLAAVAAVLNWTAIWRGAVVPEQIAKVTVLFALFAAAILWSMAPGASAAVRVCLIVALAASLMGDAFLLRPDRFVPGLVAFLVAHLAYLAAFLQLPGSDWGAVAGVTVAFAVIAFLGRDIVAGARPSGLRVPVAIYLVVICAMATAATHTLLPAAIAGAWLFVASDSILGWDRFVAPRAASDREARGRHLAVMVTYHLGQALLVVALAG